MAPKCQSLSLWRLLGDLPGSSLCGQCLRIGGCLHPDRVSQRYISMAFFLSEPRAATSLLGVLGPPHCLPQPWPSKWTPLLALFPWPVPVPWPWSGVSVRKGPGTRHIWHSGRGPLVGDLVLQSLFLHSEFKVKVRGEGFLTWGSPPKPRSLGGSRAWPSSQAA